MKDTLTIPSVDVPMNGYTIALVVLLSMLVILIWQANRKKKLDWTDLITARNSMKVSLTKVLQLVGGITGTWIMIYMTMKGLLSTELFMTYLAYVGAIEGWSKFVSARYSGLLPSSPQSLDQSDMYTQDGSDYTTRRQPNQARRPNPTNQPAPNVQDVLGEDRN